MFLVVESHLHNFTIHLSHPLHHSISRQFSSLPKHHSQHVAAVRWPLNIVGTCWYSESARPLDKINNIWYVAKCTSNDHPLHWLPVTSLYGRSFAKCLSVTCLTTSSNKLWNPNQNCLLCPMQLTLKTHLITNSRYYSSIEHTTDYHESLSSLPHKNPRILYLYSWCTWILHLNKPSPLPPPCPPCHSFVFFPDLYNGELFVP